MRPIAYITITVAVCAGVAMTACGKDTPQGAAPSATAAAAGMSPEKAAAEAKDRFKECVVCHGESGKGDGPGAAALTPKPRDYTDPAWQASVTDEQIEKTIIQGGAAVGKSPSMPPHPDLKKKPEVAKALVKMIRAFKKP
jgi:cytochrome c553